MFTRSHKRLPVLALLTFALTTAGMAMGVGYWSTPSGLQPTIGNDSRVDPSVDFSKLRFSFEPNVGQTGGPVRYQAHVPGTDLFFTPSEVVVALNAQNMETNGAERGGRAAGLAAPNNDATFAKNSVRIQFLDANLAPEIEHGAAMPGKVNYLMGSDSSAWHTNIPLYSDITYKGLYDGVNLSYSGEGGRLKGTYMVAAGAHPSAIGWRYAGANNPRVDSDGNLQISVGNATSAARHSTITEVAPEAWQEADGKRVSVNVRYEVRPDGSVGFGLGPHDPACPLVIDPVLTFSTYLGGGETDLAYGIAVDPARNVYILGVTS